MRPRSSKPARQAGFSFVELLVTATSLVIILVVSTQLMFAMRRGVVRQQLQVEARQNARAAADYASMLLRGATDFNRASNNSGAVLTWLTKNASGSVVCPGDATCYQVSYNNLGDGQAALGDPGTDIVTFARPVNTRMIVPLRWPGWQHAANVSWDAKPFCADRANNAAQAFADFKLATGEHGDKSDPLLLIDDTGAMAFYQITNYGNFAGPDCTDPNNQCRGAHDDPPLQDEEMICFKVGSNPGLSDGINPPGGQPDLDHPRLLIGVRFASFRIRTDPATGIPWLEQKDGIFDPATDNPGTAFVPLLPNVEDMQVAWIFRNGEIRDQSPANQIPDLPDGTGTLQVPPANTAGPWAYDVRNVVGFRVTFTARSGQAMPMERGGNRFVRPAAEDRAAGTVRDNVYRYQASANALIRNRLAGS